MPWEISSERTIYMQLMDYIKLRILSGEYKPGDKVASVRDLATEAAVNPNTMQRALTELERIGLLYTQRTNGRFITEDTNLIEATRNDMAKQETMAYLEKMRSLGLDNTTIRSIIASQAE